ncbi:DUF1476 domain-containing protein [Aquisalinus flavus]|uniref:DUF1476 domain-containing protein n=1 Tax=Aquisalinus flavus TaxID=1526572 RepID=A0A8J2V5R5_9PROT|nr:DUF1476 domain-containing protein [Aquisalinus flavus]MBD0426168.1 DUF1476 domain-containing protein [Aquisalinus flavus]UNE48255.1 DUF1476 domain-containing protein [Aquisalinus flavus]GGD10038.1 hypothetical protein GCM10011342_18700 [Aquisalinus flavus]
MSTFEDREDRFEQEYKHNADVQFKVEARRNKLLGLWAAEKLGMNAADAAEYAKSVVLADLDEPGEEDVFRKVRADLDKASTKVTDEEIRQQMASLMPIAKEQVRKGE